MGLQISQLDELLHDTGGGTNNSLVKIDSTHFILAYAGIGSDGYIATFSIDGSGNITEIDSLEHDTTNGTYNSLIALDSTHFMLAFKSNSVGGEVKIFTLDGSYNITQTSSLILSNSSFSNNSLVKIDSTHAILAYAGTDNDGFIVTLSVDGSYVITETDRLEHDTVGGTFNSLVQIDSTHYALACRAGSSVDGVIKIFTLDGSYNITQTSSYTHDTSSGVANSLVLLDSTHLALDYSDVNYDGKLKTFSFDGSYNVTEIDSLVYHVGSHGQGSLILNDTKKLSLSMYDYGTGIDGHIYYFELDASYNITKKYTYYQIIETVLSGSLANIDSTHFMCAIGNSSDGYIQSYEIAVIEETQTATFTELTPAVSGNADPVNPSYIDGLSSFLTTWSGVHTAYSFNNTNANTGTDTTHDANSSSYAQISTANFPNYGTDAKCEPDISGDMDIYILTDVAMMIYVPSGLTADVNYGLFHNGGGTNAQCGWISNVTGDGITLCISHNAGATNQDEDYYILPGGGDRWYCIGFQFEDNLDNMALWVDGENRSEVARTYELLYGSGDPDIGDSDGVHPSQWGAESPIDGTGIIIANMVVDNPNSTNTTPPGNGDTFYTDFYDEHIAPTAGGSKINIGDDFKEIASVSINIGDSWKPVTSIKLNVGDSWKDVNI